MQNETRYFGALLGRVVNRIGGAQFTLNGTVYKLVPNEGNNTIHGIPFNYAFSYSFSQISFSYLVKLQNTGGPKGFSFVVWKVSEYVKDGPCPHLTLTYHSADGEEGSLSVILKKSTD